MPKQFPDVATEQYHIDILTAHFVRRPASFDVVVASNLFRRHPFRPRAGGDGYDRRSAPSGNLNPERRFPSMFEPVHGSAPGYRRPEHRQPDRPDLVEAR